MIEYHGWAIIREAYDEKGEDQSKLADIVKEIRQRILQIDTTNEFYDLRYLNGSLHLTIQGDHNHRDNQIIDFYKWVASIAVGSYGLLHVRDDEDSQRGNENKFKVWRMKRGQVDELDDTLLSPYFPTVGI